MFDVCLGVNLNGKYRSDPEVWDENLGVNLYAMVYGIIWEGHMMERHSGVYLYLQEI